MIAGADWRVLAVIVTMLVTGGPLRAQQDAADSAWARGDRTAAERLYAKRLAADSRDGVAMFRLGQLAGWRGRWAESMGWFDRLLQIWPADNDARIARVRVLTRMGRHADAEATVDTVLSLQPDNIGGQQARARLAGFAGDLIESERLWRDVLERDPANAETRVGLSQVLRRQGRVAAAEATLMPVKDRAPADPDLNDELERVATLSAPRARARVVREDDSDGNTISTLALHSASLAMPRVEVRGDAWFRMASLDGAASDVAARGGVLTLWSQLEPGWTVHASGGVAATDRPDLDAMATWAVAVGSPRRHRWSATATASRQSYDYTAPMAANGIRVDEVELAASGRPVRDWTVDAALAKGTFESRRSGVRNGRVKGRVSFAHSTSEVLSLAFQASGFGFERDTDDGYFDPDLYGMAAIELQFRRETRRWTATAALAPGFQKIGQEGSTSGALRAQAGFELIGRPGRSVGLNAVWANTGMQQLSDRPAGSYRYASLGLDIRWRFR